MWTYTYQISQTKHKTLKEGKKQEEREKKEKKILLIKSGLENERRERGRSKTASEQQERKPNGLRRPALMSADHNLRHVPPKIHLHFSLNVLLAFC